MQDFEWECDIGKQLKKINIEVQVYYREYVEGSLGLGESLDWEYEEKYSNGMFASSLIC